MSDPIAVILRFNGDPDDLLGRFGQARKSWIEAQDDGWNPPIFFAICEAEMESSSLPPGKPERITRHSGSR